MRNHTKLNIINVWQCNFKQGPILYIVCNHAVTASLPKMMLIHVLYIEPVMKKKDYFVILEVFFVYNMLIDVNNSQLN